MPDMVFKENTSSAEDISAHFLSCGKEFYEDLAERVNIEAYIKKLVEKSFRHEAWIEDGLAGLLAIYRNGDFDFITNLSVSGEYLKRGIASCLLKRAIETGKSGSSDEIRLEVSKNNVKALKLYEKFGFVRQGQKDRFFSLGLRLR